MMVMIILLLIYYTLMIRRFDEHFRLDEHGLPKKWGKTDDIASVFKLARVQVNIDKSTN